MLHLQFLEPFFFDRLINHSNFWFIHLFMSSAMDVLLSTASIMNLCLISLDRYWSITKAVEYLKTRTPTRALVMIAAVWMMSALICIPPLLGWGVKRSEDSLPQCEVSCTNLFIFGIYYGAGHWIINQKDIFLQCGPIYEKINRRKYIWKPSKHRLERILMGYTRSFWTTLNILPVEILH